MLGDCVCDCDLRRARNSRSDPTSSRCQIAHPREHCARTAAQNFCASEPNPTGGARRDRTDDLLLAKQALSQLSYGPSPVSYASRHLGLPAEPQLARGNRPPSSFGLRRGSLRLACASEGLVGLGRFELPTSRLSSARSNQLSYKPGFGRRMTDDGGQIFASSVVRHLPSVVCPELLVREEREMKTAVSRK